MNKLWHDQFTGPGAGVGKQMPHTLNWIQHYGLQHSYLWDYGCGKGGTMTWLKSLIPTVRIDGVDPHTHNYNVIPHTKPDAVYSQDVLEHLTEQELMEWQQWITTQRPPRSQAKRWHHSHIIDTTPAKKRLPTGENAHRTLRTPTEWMEWFEQFSQIERVQVWNQPDRLWGERVRVVIWCEIG